MEMTKAASVGKTEITSNTTITAGPEGNRLSPMLGMNRKQRRAVEAQIRQLSRKR